MQISQVMRQAQVSVTNNYDRYTEIDLRLSGRDIWVEMGSPSPLIPEADIRLMIKDVPDEIFDSIRTGRKIKVTVEFME